MIVELRKVRIKCDNCNCRIDHWSENDTDLPPYWTWVHPRGDLCPLCSLALKEKISEGID